MPEGRIRILVSATTGTTSLDQALDMIIERTTAIAEKLRQIEVDLCRWADDGGAQP